jgi:SAM-dependent methyltransferase
VTAYDSIPEYTFLGSDQVVRAVSGAAVAEARRLARELDIDARFVQADVYDAASALGGETFDVVVTTYGVLAWLPDIRRWAEVAASLVAPGGTFYIAEIHPASQVLDDEPGVEDLRVGYPYWTRSGPLRFQEAGTYADYDAEIELPEYIWLHGLGEIVTALIDAGLVVEFLHEHEQTVFQQLPFLEQDDEGWWRLPADQPSLPLLFSLRATGSGRRTPRPSRGRPRRGTAPAATS